VSKQFETLLDTRDECHRRCLSCGTDFWSNAYGDNVVAIDYALYAECPTCKRHEHLKLPREQLLHRVWSVLVEHAGAKESMRDEFLNVHDYEFRFQGVLGFGGKVYGKHVLHIDCYTEDYTPERLAIIERVNIILACVSLSE